MCGIVYPVMFVDGIVLLSQTMIGLQKQLNSLCHAGSTLKLRSIGTRAAKWFLEQAASWYDVNLSSISV